MEDVMTQPEGQEPEPPQSKVIPELKPEVVVRRNGAVSVIVAMLASVMAAAYLARAITSGSALDWTLCGLLIALTWAHVFTLLDARVPLLVADDYGVRIRLGRTWRGMSWSDLEEVEHLPRRGPLRDGRLVLFPVDLDKELDLLGPTGRRHARINARLNGAPFALPLGLTTRLLGAQSGLAAALAELADGRCDIVEVRPEVAEAPEEVDEGEVDPPVIHGRVDEAEDQEEDHEEDEEAVAALVASPTPSPAREPLVAVRGEVHRETDHTFDPDATQPISVLPLAETSVTARIDDLADVPVLDPVIGPELAAARRGLHLDVDQLAERTHIRPHVIEAIEVDDFEPCGGDFYARGHLRTLARVVGVDVAPLLATYDEKYADAPIDPRRVFEAELATGRSGPIRGTRGGPNWSVLVAAVMTVVLAWSVARLVMDDPTKVSTNAAGLADSSAGLSSSQTHAAPVPVVITAAGGGAHVVVRDGVGKVAFAGSLAFGQSKTLRVAPPVRVQSTDGSLRVSVDGQDHGALGRTGQPGEKVFTGR